MRFGLQEVAAHSPRSHRLAVALALEREVLLGGEFEVLKLPWDSKPILMSHIQNHMAGHLQMSSVTPHRSHTKARNNLTCRSDWFMCEVFSSKIIVECRPYFFKWEHVQLARWRTCTEAKVSSTRLTSVWRNIVRVKLLPGGIELGSELALEAQHDGTNYVPRLIDSMIENCWIFLQTRFVDCAWLID